ncbi:hypothetical protein BMT55_16065 [Listeria newyorkensis]|uniref:Uncharacterized protein n=1 Tax=Listeria newyorkensis TaxID=1497681 RepID=A0ABX4XIT8_9LIST|nr:hypothetical protein [Listeria newyorkensis]PNP87438.1 hypothetical protein BMT55_16065 [Listeria newyorkensis]
MTDLEKMDERQKMMLWHMRDDYVHFRNLNDLTPSLYLLFDQLTGPQECLFSKYEKFTGKEKIQIIRAFTNWALEQEDAE